MAKKIKVPLSAPEALAALAGGAPPVDKIHWIPPPVTTQAPPNSSLTPRGYESLGDPERGVVLAFHAKNPATIPSREEALALLREALGNPDVNYDKAAWEGRDFVVTSFPKTGEYTLNLVVCLKGPRYFNLPLSSFAMERMIPGWVATWPDWNPEAMRRRDDWIQNLTNGLKMADSLVNDLIAQQHPREARAAKAALDAIKTETLGTENANYKKGERVRTVSEILNDIQSAL